VTVVIGVVTVAVVPAGAVTVTAVTGVLTVTVAGDVWTGTAGRETFGTRSVVGEGDVATPAVDERTDAAVASPSDPCVATLPEPPAVLK
jgi:hypothetical protein